MTLVSGMLALVFAYVGWKIISMKADRAIGGMKLLAWLCLLGFSFHNMVIFLGEGMMDKAIMVVGAVYLAYWFRQMECGAVSVELIDKQQEEELNQLQFAIRSDPTNWAAVERMGEIYAKQGRLREALSQYQRAEKMSRSKSNWQWEISRLEAAINAGQESGEGSKSGTSFSSTVFSTAFYLMLAVLLGLAPYYRHQIKAMAMQRTSTFSDDLSSANLMENGSGWKIRPLDGVFTTFADFRDRVIFLNIWATWCGPCRDEMPSIQSLYNRGRNDAALKSVSFVLVSNESASTVRSFMEQNQYTFPVYTTDRVPKFMDVRGIPATFVLNKKGEMVMSRVGSWNWDNPETIELLRNLSGE